MGATAFQKGLGAIHSLSHPVGALYNTHHGMTNAVFMPYVLEFNRAAIEKKVDRLAAWLGISEGFEGFLQAVLDEFSLIPIVVGACPAEEVANVLEVLWGGDETLIVGSSDLSHFHSYADARALDARTTQRIEAGETTLHGEEACGAYALNGLLLAADAHGLRVRTLDVRNSGDTAGDRQRVVGYGAYALG